MTPSKILLQQGFEPSIQAAHARLAAVNPHEYAATRNAIDGAVTRLSPYISHGFLSLPEVLQSVHARHPLMPTHKFVYELGWRAYFHHVWEHEGDGIFESLHQGPLPDDAYASTLPADIRQARTGIPAIDTAVHTRMQRATCTTTRACGWLRTSFMCGGCIGWRVQTGCLATCLTAIWRATTSAGSG